MPDRHARAERQQRQGGVPQRQRAGLAELPEPYREVIRLRDLEGLDAEEMAARFGTTAG